MFGREKYSIALCVLSLLIFNPTAFTNHSGTRRNKRCPNY